MGLTSGIFAKGAAPVLERALSFCEQRHRVIAQNIANVETPGYKPSDLDEQEFQQALKAEMEARDARAVRRFGTIEGRHLHETSAGLRVLPVSHSSGILRHSENRVDMESEMTRLAENGLKFRVYSSLVKKHYTQLRDTISERA